jgi:GT2 family glycosyltransferase
MTNGSDTRKAPSCFIIATRNRHDDLTRTVQSLAEQTVLPAELCIVDSSKEPVARDCIERLCAVAEISLDYVHPAPRGLPVQRNVGIDRTTGDPVFLIDDDVLMAPDVHENILAEYARWGPALGGVCGMPLRPSVPNGLLILWRRVFGLGGWWPEASGRVRRGFYPERANVASAARTVEFFAGWFMSYRREVFEHERFDENLSGYAFKEDIDFSYRLSKRGYVLVQTPEARIEHLKAAPERLTPFDHQRMALANQFYLHRKNMPQTLRNKAALWWALAGTLPFNVGKVLQTRDPGYLAGFFVGAWEQARGRGLIDPAAEERRVEELRGER